MSMRVSSVQAICIGALRVMTIAVRNHYFNIFWMTHIVQTFYVHIARANYRESEHRWHDQNYLDVEAILPFVFCRNHTRKPVPNEYTERDHTL